MDWSTLAKMNLGGTLTLGGVFSAVVTLLICLIVIQILMKILRRLIGKTRLDERVQKYILSGVRLVLYIITVIIVVEALGVNATSLVALLSVCSLGITLAAEDVLGNMAGGLVLLSSHPFTIGDFIEADGVSGTVEDISLNRTKLLTIDGLTVLVPNRTLSSGKLTNYTTLGRRRACRKISASYDAPPEAVKAACFAALERTPNKLADPAPSVTLLEFGSGSIEYGVYCWSTTGDYWQMYLTLGENLRDTFREWNVKMPREYLNVQILSEDARQTRGAEDSGEGL